MRQFLAILKDSFREAVDGFVIYAMLALSALLVLVVASLSFTPAPADEAFQKIVPHFNQVFPDEGRSRVVTFPRNHTTYNVTNVQPAGGGYTFRLTATGSRSGPDVAVAEAVADEPEGKKPAEEKKEKKDRGDSFRETVAAWAATAGESEEVEIDAKGQAKKVDKKKGPGKGGGRRVSFGQQREVPVAEQRAVTDEKMAAFLKNQFYMHAGMDADVRRVAEPGADEPTYQFDVTTHGGSSVRGWPHTVKIFFGAVTMLRDINLGQLLFVIEDQIINGLGSTLALLVSLIITAFFIPNMIRKGSLDLLIAKPIGRSQLLVYKFVGGLTFIFLLSCVAIGGVWLALAVRSGYWDPSFLVVIPVLTFTFAILYSVSTLTAVLTRSPIAAMLVSVGFAFFLYIVGQVKSAFDMMKEMGNDDIPGWAFTLVDTINNVLPRYKDLDRLTSKLLGGGTLTPGEYRSHGLAMMDASWAGTFGVSLAFIALMLVLACWRFQRRDS